MKKALFFLLLLLFATGVHAQRSVGVAQVDPFILDDTISASFVPLSTGGLYVNQQTVGLAARSQAFNPAQKTLVLIVAGQSLCATITPTLYTPTSSAAIDNFSIYDGASYPPTGIPIGVEYYPGHGPGNVSPNLAQLFITNAIFDRVVYTSICVGGTLAAQWATGPLAKRIGVTMKRLISRGYVPGSTGLTFALSWWQGETDNTSSTAQAAYAASMATVIGQYQSLCSGCRFFVNLETWATVSGVTSATVRAAQASLPNGTTIFQGGDIDTLNATNRQADNTHLNDTGRAAAATLVYNAMHASGAPF